MRIAGNEVSRTDAHEQVRTYAKRFYNTLKYFDGVGMGRSVDDSPNEVTLADLGRLVIINAGLEADDVPALLDVDAEAALAAVPPNAKLEECEPGTQLWNAASKLYALFQLPNIGKAKRSKLLHLKRPGLIRINDSVTEAKYRKSAKEIASKADYETEGYWEAARNDILQDEFAELMRDVANVTVPQLGGASLASLSAVRVLDIVCWAD